ncbi:MAG: hypothetical protein GC191_13005 [Azospirillum sp.]|nr:hypothetical protein [Azospirillum sp.]
MNAYERLLLPENLNYAWLKARSLYRGADGYIDAGELAEFELDLERRLFDIRRQFENANYRLKKLRPLPRPKKIGKDRPVDRQYYHVAVEDQVAWIAVVNALGPDLDKKMPPWSYGNRLYRPAWYETSENRLSTLEIGPYRHASGHLYRKFQHSWPLFRRHVTLTARMMVARRRLRREEMDETEERAVASAERDALPFFENDFWSPKGSTATGNDLYHASIDLKQFYPQLKTKAIVDGLAAAGASEDPRIQRLINDMLRFRIDTSGMPEVALAHVDPPFLRRSVRGLPTGLFVAGFLANAAMLSVDSAVSEKLDELRSVAHFRFVDDHTIIAYDFDTLCDWIVWYEKLLDNYGIGAAVNSDKYDPPSLSKWMTLHKKATGSPSPPSGNAKRRYDAKRHMAMRDTRLDGKNPTALMTKTLAQVSAIAATNIHILDDEDLEERLKMLEWLLLADIPEREIRPDTRASFAAGQIASLAPVLVQEGDGLVNAARGLALAKSREPKPKHASPEDLKQYREEIARLEHELRKCEKLHDQAENKLLARCFSLLLQSFRDHPGKARLFYRIHQYCRVTGYSGLAHIADWLKETRAAGRGIWADYYAGLSLQLLAGGILTAVRQIGAADALRSDIKANLQYINDVSNLQVDDFLIPADREAWFHSVGRREFGTAILAVIEVLSGRADAGSLPAKLMTLARRCIAVAPGAPPDAWEAETGRTSGAWAHLAENVLGDASKPSAAWQMFSQYFAFGHRVDALAARRYPEWIPESGWEQLLRAKVPLPEGDSGWLCEVIGTDAARRAKARASGKIAFSRAARSLELPHEDWITVAQWTDSVTACSPFDPRRSEWTALEITAQLLEPLTALDGNETILDRLHPNNVLLPRAWISRFACHLDWTEVDWEEWRRFAESAEAGSPKLRDPSTSVIDYRYAADGKMGLRLDNWERRLVAIGRLLIGLLRYDYSSPRIWNLRGNEHIVRLPRARWFEALAISSPTLLLVESCLGARASETRSVARTPSLFGWRDGQVANDAKFDPPLLIGATALLEAIRHAQKVLRENQLSVTMNQPRQLIPFRLSDFSAGIEAEEGDGDENVE